MRIKQFRRDYGPNISLNKINGSEGMSIIDAKLFRNITY